MPARNRRAHHSPDQARSARCRSFRGAGRFLAFLADENNLHNVSASVAVHVFDLRARRPVRAIELPSKAPDDPTRLRLSSLILAATGTAAWRETGGVDRIGALDLHGRRVVLASGPRGSIRDLVLVGATTARWRNDGELQRRRLDRLGR